MSFTGLQTSAGNNILKATSEYKAEALKVTAAILFFAVVYIALVSIAVILGAAVSFIGLKIILFKPAFVTVMVGLGLIGLGLMVIFFLIKFIFTDHKIDRSGYKEIFKEDYPELFEFIRQLTVQTCTPFPKRIYLTADVNACVFYDSSFLSLFFPVKKNLLIGLGFINCVNKSEFKAVLAHEFGHFSQHSMRLGSYVFNVNKIIYNMLFDNEDYARTIDKWAEASAFFAFFARLTIKIVEFIQFVLRKVYVVVNKANLSLSRQMEHHADTVAAVFAGPNNIISALKRLEVGASCYSVLMNKYDSWYSEGLKPLNLFDQHREVIHHFASEHGYELVNGLPKADLLKNSNIPQSRISYKDQWSSHPSDKEREVYLNHLNLTDHEIINETPWSLFPDYQNLQEKITNDVFLAINGKNESALLDINAFREKYYDEFNKHSFNKRYNGFYNNRRIRKFDISSLNLKPKFACFEDLYRDEHVILPKQLEAVTSDIHLLKGLETSDVKTFDFDGNTCSKRDIPGLVKRLEEEQMALQSKLEELDREVYHFFIQKSDSSQKEKISELYKTYFRISQDSEYAVKDYEELMTVLNPLYTQRLEYESALDVVLEAKEVEEKIKSSVKQNFQELLQENYINENQAKVLKEFINRERTYISKTGFYNEELDLLNEAVNIYLNSIFEREFKIKKELLNKQLEAID